MGIVARTRAVGVVCALVLSPGATIASAADTPGIVVHIHARTEVPPRDMETARREVVDVLRAAGVEVEWTDTPVIGSTVDSNGSRSHRRHVTVLLVRIENAKPGAAGCALGLAVASRATAYVFYNRVVDASRTRPVDEGIVLGRVIAHEIGHLLLPPGRHSRYGIMRGELDFGHANPNRFTEDEAQAIRAALVPRSPGR